MTIKIELPPVLNKTQEERALTHWLNKLILLVKDLQNSSNTIVTDHGELAGLTDDDHLQYLLANGTRQLSGNWDAGSYEIRAETLESDVATGTAPLTVASTTLVTNLNADLLDGLHSSSFVGVGTAILSGTAPLSKSSTNLGLDYSSHFALSGTSLKIDSGQILNSHISGAAEIAMSKITATASDATLQNVMENFIDGCFVYRVDGDNIGVTAGSIMINGELRRNTSATVNITYSAPDNGDWLDVWALADTATSTCTFSIVDSGTAPGGSSNPGTNGRMIGTIKYIDGTTKINLIINYRQDYIIGWTYKVGADSANLNLDQQVFGKTFSHLPLVNISIVCGLNSIPTTSSAGDTTFGNACTMNIFQPSTTTFDCYIRAETGTTFSSSYYWIFHWVAYGRYS